MDFSRLVFLVYIKNCPDCFNFIVHQPEMTHTSYIAHTEQYISHYDPQLLYKIFFNE